MNVTVKPKDLSPEIQKQLKQWNVEVRRAVNEGVKDTARTAAKMLRQGGPYHERTGEYSKGWVHELRRKRSAAVTGVEVYSVHNKKHYQITHLLEHGHQSRNGGRVKKYEHIEPVEEFAGQLAVSNAQKRIRELNK